MNAPFLVFCGGKNRRHAAIAGAAGFAYGVASGDKPHAPVAFLDLDWRRPNWPRHLAVARTLRPRLAVAGDIDDAASAPVVLAQAAALRPWVDDVIVVPRAPGLVDLVPDWCVVGLSVPSVFGGTQAPYWEYTGRRLHLLGGTPHAQMQLWCYFPDTTVSIDGNSHQAAARFGSFWEAGRWVTRQYAAAVEPPGPDLYARCFARSCANIVAAWAALTGDPPAGEGRPRLAE